MPDDKLQVGVYKIDTDHDCFVDSESVIETLSEAIQDEDAGFAVQDVMDDIAAEYEIILLYKKNPQSPKWKRFLTGIARDNQDILKEMQSWAESFVLLFAHSTTGNLYAVTGGMGYFAVQDVIDDDFGIDIISRLIKKEDRILKAIREKSVMGGVLGSTKHFRKTYNLYENDSFGKIYQELNATMDTEMLTTHFGFSVDELKRDSVCVAKSSFRINKAISFEQLLKIVNGCEYVLDNLTPIAINNVEKVIKKRSQDLIQQLDNRLYEQLWTRYEDSSATIDFDLCHKEYEDYLTASAYVIKKNTSQNNYFGDYEFETLQNIDSLFEQMKTVDEPPRDASSLRKLLSVLKIYSYDEESNELTKGWLYNHIFGDIDIDGTKYFLIDNNWYRIKLGFLNELNASCKEFIQSNAYEGLGKLWDYPSKKENEYSKEYIGEPNTLVLDKITPSNIEPCDILIWNQQDLFLVHVKAAFGNTMRDLCSQIFIAANRIKADRNSSLEYIGEIYDELQNKVGSGDTYFDLVGRQTEGVSRDEFVNLFTTKRHVFVLAVLDTATTERDIREPQQFNSNIAKFSLQELIKGMKGIDVDFRITQVFRPASGQSRPSH